MLPRYAAKCLDPNLKPAQRQSAVNTMRRLARTAWDPDTEVVVRVGRDAYDPDASDKCGPEAATVLEVLKAAAACRDYDLVNNVIDWAAADVRPTRTFGLIKSLTLAGGIDVSKIKKRSVDIGSYTTPHSPRLTACSMLDSVSQRDLSDRKGCVEVLRPSKRWKETTADLEELAAEIVDQSIEKLEDDLKSGFL